MSSSNTMSAPTNDHFLCPITQEVMADPVIGSDGITYERSAIEAWFAAGHRTSPLTRQPMVSQSLVPNIALRSMIQDAQRASPPASLQPQEVREQRRQRQHPHQPPLCQLSARPSAMW